VVHERLLLEQDVVTYTGPAASVAITANHP
jgi:hypothetical protein